MPNIRRLMQENAAEATRKMTMLLESRLPLKVSPGSLRFQFASAVALNSFRAEFKTENGQHLFVKCPLEDNKEDQPNEYHRGKMLAEAGFPIDQALYQLSEQEEQLVIYNYLDRQITPELHDVARRIEAQGCVSSDVAPVAAAYDDFQQKLGEIYLATLHQAKPHEAASELVHTLFHGRIVDHENDNVFGARVSKFYVGQDVPLPDNTSVSFEEFWELKWDINGLHYNFTLRDAFEQARCILKPTQKTPVSAVIAHGDDHTANLLYDCHAPAGQRIKFFDPAVAGEHIPALQAAARALYYVNFAHPNMLYDPSELKNEVSFTIENDRIKVRHNWDLTPLRQRFLQSQIKHVWQPLIAEMGKRNVLPDNWEKVVRSTLFCCPVLCKSLLAGQASTNPLTPEASLLTFAIAMQLAGPPESGYDRVSELFEKKIMPGLRG